MADDLKRVGIKLTAEGARDFKTELKECTAATKENYSELKLAQSQYDKNTSSTKKLQDRQKYLASQTDVYKDKVKILNSQLKEMESAEHRDETAISKKRAELNQAQAKLNDYEKSLEEVNKQLSTHSEKLKDWGGKLQDIGGKTKAVGDNMTKYATGPIVAAGGASVVAWKEVDSAMDIVIRKTGATGKAADELKSSVKKLATEIPTDFNTAAEAVGEVNTRFGLTGNALEGLSGKFIKFAELNNTDVSSSVDATQKALSAYGLSADHAGDFLDRMNKVGQDTGVSVDKLAGGIVSNATAFKEMGMNIDQATTFMGALEKSGANSETVLNGMRKALKNATDKGIPLNQALSDLQNTILNGTGSVDGLSESYKLFGKSGDQIYGAVRDGTIDFNALAASVENAGGSVEQTFKDTKDPMDGLKTVMNELKIVGADIVTSSAPMIKEAVGAVRDVVKDLAAKWNGLSDGQKQFIVKAAIVVAAVGPVLSVLGSVIMVIGTLMTTLSTLGIGLAPFLAGGAIIIGIIAGAALLIANWDKVKEAFGRIGEAIKKTWNELTKSTRQLCDDAKKAWNGMKTAVTNTASGLVNGAKQKFNDLKTNAENIFEKIKGFAKFTWNLPSLGFDLLLKAPKKAKEIVDKIKGLFDFDWSLPKPKMPHIKWHWESIGGVLDIPSFDGVDWYAKAYDRAAYYNRPTVRGDGRGYGDRQGGEFAVGERHLRNVIRDELSSGKDDRPVNFTVNMTINGAPGQDEEKLAGIVVDKLRTIYEREEAVWA